MAFKISGFGATQKEEKSIAPTCETYQQTLAPRKSLVQIRFPGKGMTLTYYNDQFDLKPGDCVYVDGKISGDEIDDFIYIQEELERISITVETLQLWAEKILANGVIDAEAYNARKNK